jgi:hypothetical protein
MEQAYQEFIKKHGVLDNLFTRTIFNAGYNAGKESKD